MRQNIAVALGFAFSLGDYTCADFQLSSLCLYRNDRYVVFHAGRRIAHLDPLHSLLFGALAGAAAESSVYPFEVIRRRMQTMAAAAAVSTSGGGGAVTAARVASLVAFRQAATDIWARDRLRGFYSGIVPNTVQVREPPQTCWDTLGRLRVC